MIHRGTLWMHGLVENVLCAAHFRAGRIQLQLRPLDLIDAVTEIRPVVEPLLVQKAQRLRLASRRALPPISADSRRIPQVLVNLVSNASKFSAIGQPIDITLTTRRDYCRVSVADRGPGIPAGSAQRLFEPFYRADATGQSATEGGGLGLAMVKAIIDAHRGRVGAANRPGGGARCWFEVPAVTLATRPRAGSRACKEETR